METPLSTLNRRSFLRIPAAWVAALSLGWGAIAMAQPSWPTKPLHMVVTFAPGGVTDSVARLIGEHLGKRLGQPVIVENKPGAAGNIGAGYVAKAEPDGHTMVLVLEGTITVNPHLFDKMGYNPVKDLTPTGKVGDSTIVFVAHPSLGAKTLNEAVTLSKQRPGGLSYGTAGAVTITHIAGEFMRQRTGGNFVHIPYKGGAPAVADVLGGQIPLGFVSAASVQQHIKSGKLVALGVPSAKRSASLPEVPTFQEAGLTDFEVNSWAGIFAPAATPAAVLEKFNTELNAVLSDPVVADKLAIIGIHATPIKLDAFKADLRKELAAFGPLLKQAGIRPDGGS